QPPLRRLRAVLAAADDRLAAGKPAEALAILWHPWVLAYPDTQSFARLAAAQLAREPATPFERFQVIHALAAYCDLLASPLATWRDLPIAEAWDQQRLEDLAARCQAWLDGA
ncbi:MAG: hypothetical protein V1750_05570, partial [Acidobacteriota bacterium]